MTRRPREAIRRPATRLQPGAMGPRQECVLVVRRRSVVFVIEQQLVGRQLILVIIRIFVLVVIIVLVIEWYAADVWQWCYRGR
ncbi:MAG: hypothetical protein IPM54_12575 [Polyangiaceae bacterium]|nr:hypothetical protein [Polyangiaceae bacterium]